MSSIRSKLVKYFFVRQSMRKTFDPYVKTIEIMRDACFKLGKRVKLPQDAVIEPITLDSVKAEWLRDQKVDQNTPKILLYFHSGGFCLPYTNAHRDLALRISKANNLRVLAIDYRLAPEDRYPSALEDCMNSYQWLLDMKIKPDDIIIGGDSAGAGLVLMTLLGIKEKALPMPKAAFLLSLYGGDLKNFDGESYSTRQLSDPLNYKKGIQKFAAWFLGDHILEPHINRELTGLPDLFIQAGDDEILLSDSLRLAERSKAAGVNVTLEIWDNMWHAFQGFSMIVPESRQAIRSLNQFIQKQLVTNQ